MKTINKIINFISEVSKDKLLHFMAGFIITEVISILIFAILHPSYRGAIVGLIVGIVVAVIKELSDKYHNDKASSFKDFISTAIGSIISFLLMLLLTL